MLQGKYPLLIALVLGLLAGIIAYSAIKARERAVRVGWDTRRILCAKVDVEEGTELDEEMITICEIPERFITESFFVIPEGDEQGGMMPFGQKVLVPLRTGDPILYSHFESEREFTIAEAVPLKARAMSIEVSEKSAVSQWIRPNDHVDVVGTFRDPEGQDLVSVTLLQNIIVLATGRYSGMSTYQTEEDKRYTHVTLLVLPEEAEILALASESGTLTLTLRNPKDLEGKDASAMQLLTNTKTLLTGDRQEAARKKREATFQAPSVGPEIIRGTTGTREKGDASIPGGN